jgi:hypothetical protein
MVRDRSKLIICERVVPDTHSPLAISEFDLVMGALFGSMERSKEQFLGIFDKVEPAIALRGITTDDPIRESFLEVELS